MSRLTPFVRSWESPAGPRMPSWVAGVIGPLSGLGCHDSHLQALVGGDAGKHLWQQGRPRQGLELGGAGRGLCSQQALPGRHPGPGTSCQPAGGRRPVGSPAPDPCPGPPPWVPADTRATAVCLEGFPAPRGHGPTLRLPIFPP